MEAAQKKDSAGRSSDRRAYPQNLKGVSVQAERNRYNEKIACLFSKQDGENIRFCQADTDIAPADCRGILETGFFEV